MGDNDALGNNGNEYGNEGSLPLGSHRAEDESLFFNPVYGRDCDLEKLFCDIGGHSAILAFISGFTDLIIDDEKMRMRSALANTMSLSRSKSGKAFGPVGNCINSVATGIPLLCHMSHHGESVTKIIK